jgi:intergrase/recombinase
VKHATLSNEFRNNHALRFDSGLKCACLKRAFSRPIPAKIGGAPAGIRTRVFGSKGLQQSGTTLQWPSLRKGFLTYLSANGYSTKYIDDLRHYLDEYVTVISVPTDILDIFSKVNRGRRHVWLGLRVLFNYLEVVGYGIGFLNGLRKALPKVSCGIDLKVPSEKAMRDPLNRLIKAPRKYQVLYNLLVDSGLRLVEAVKVLSEFKLANVERVGGFYRVEIGTFRGTKQAFYGYFTESTFKMLTEVPVESVFSVPASRYFTKMRFVQAKYVRKFAFDKMIELEIPESVADFIEGRVPKRIGAKHYMALRRQADNFYGKYANYLSRLRSSCMLEQAS